MSYSPNVSRFRPQFESLEQRQLLAADLSVQLDAPHDLVPGDVASYSVVVTNRGPDDVDARLFSEATNYLDDANWARTTEGRGHYQLADYASGIEEHDERLVGFSRNSKTIGDINGDGREDLFLTLNPTIGKRVERSDAWVIFGSETQHDMRTLELDGTNGFHIPNVPVEINSVAGGGDVNGDGIDDLIIGSVYADPVGALDFENGASYVIFGNAGGFSPEVDVNTLDGTDGFAVRGFTTPDSFPSEGEFGSRIGSSVDIADDINGDGIDDLVIGGIGALLPVYNDAAYVVYGRSIPFSAEFQLADLNGSNGFQITDSREGHRRLLGQSVAGIGDVNADGLNDLMVGWYNCEQVGATILFGSQAARPNQLEISQLNAADGFEFRGGTLQSACAVDYPYNETLITLDGLGDVNGDDIDDFVMGTPATTQAGRYEVGAAHVVFGDPDIATSAVDSSSLDGSNGFTISTNIESDQTGITVDGLGDFDGDGMNDVLVAARHTTTRFTPESELAWVVFGSETPFESTITPADHGGSVLIQLEDIGFARPAGDINQDGRQDLIVGTASKAQFLLGQSRPEANSMDGTGNVDETLEVAAHTSVIYQVTGTVKSDLANQVLIAASAAVPNLEPVVASAGTPVFRDLDLVTIPGAFQVTAPGQAATIEFTVANHGPSNGVSSRVVSEVTQSLVDPTWTRTEVRPAPGFPASIDFNDTSQLAGLSLQELGATAVTNADFNGDSLPDIAITSGRELRLLFGSSSIGTDEVLGPIGIDALEQVVFQSGDPLSNLTLAGDLNGDGLPDLMVQQGQHSYFVFGATEYPSAIIPLESLDGSNGFRIVHDTGHLPQLVRPVGDVNGDGFSDVAVSRSDETSKPLLIVPGRPIFEAETPISEVTADSAIRVFIGLDTQRLGWSLVASAGDINSDGIPDLALGVGQDFRETAYVVFGSQTPAVVTDLSNLSVEEGFSVPVPDRYAVGQMSIESIGDVNGDRIDDLVVGRDGEEPSDLIWRSTTVLLGSSTGDFDNPRTVTLANFGYVFSYVNGAAGDINFDGLDDIFSQGDRRGPASTLFGARDILYLDTTFDSLSPMDGYQGHELRNIGDFNGDHVADILIDNEFVLFTPTVTERTVGSGDINETLDVDVHSYITYTIDGTLRDDVEVAALANSISVSVGTLRTDFDLGNNTVQQIPVFADALLGDIDRDGVVGFSDFLILSANFGSTNASSSEGDLNEDKILDFADFLLLSDNYGKRIV